MSANKEFKAAEAPKPGTVAALRAQFDKGKAAQSPVQFKATAQKAAEVVRAVPGVRSNVATYNLALRGAQVKAQRRATLQAKGATSDFELLQFTDDYEAYPWHLAAMVDDDDAFWVPDLAAALETGDERQINEAVLRLFFEEHDEGMLNAVDALLDAHEGKEDELFEELQKEYIELQLVHEEDEPASQQPALDGAPPRRKSSVFAQPAPTPLAAAQHDDDAEKPALTQEQKRRPSFIVSAMKKVDGEWAVNIQDAQMKEKMLESGADTKDVEYILGADKEKLVVDVDPSADV